MTKGNLITMALIAAAVVLVASANWAVVIFGAIFVQIDRVAARLIEQRSHPPAAFPDPPVQTATPGSR